MNPDFDDGAWRELAAGKHWENLGIEHYDGVAWYRRSIVGPEALRDHDVRLIFEGIDDSATVWLNGELIARFGDPETKTTVWLERSVAELGRRLRIGERNLIVARVVDHHGAGGLWKPVMLTTLPGTRLLAR